MVSYLDTLDQHLQKDCHQNIQQFSLTSTTDSATSRKKFPVSIHPEIILLFIISNNYGLIYIIVIIILYYYNNIVREQYCVELNSCQK